MWNIKGFVRNVAIMLEVEEAGLSKMSETSFAVMKCTHSTTNFGTLTVSPYT